jgi:uncharacterized protein YggU (UPF0235/DUF167 family)
VNTVAKKHQFNLHNGKMGAAITVRVVSKSNRDEIAEVLSDGTIKIHLVAAEDGEKSNQALIQFLAQVLGIAASNIEIIAGLSGQDKLVTILTLDADMVQDRIMKKKV